jgi:hypothetical protein
MAVNNIPESDVDALLTGEVRLKGNFYQLLEQMIELMNRNEVQFGTGSPEGVLLANTGAKYFDTAAASGSNYYVKTTDKVNTGWVLV